MLILYTMVKNSVTSKHSCGCKLTKAMVNNIDVNILYYMFFCTSTMIIKRFYIHKVSTYKE